MLCRMYDSDTEKCAVAGRYTRFIQSYPMRTLHRAIIKEEVKHHEQPVHIRG